MLFLPLENDSLHRHFDVVVGERAVGDAVWMVQVSAVAQVAMDFLVDVILNRQGLSGHCRPRPISGLKHVFAP